MKTKKELKEEYKQTKFKMGVFQIRNTVNGKILVDNSVNLDAIWNRHRAQLKFGAHPNEALQREWNEYGEACFDFEVLAEIEHREDATAADYNSDLKKLTAMFVEELKPGHIFF